MRTISVAIPTYNRFQMTINSFAKVIDDERVSEIVIVDDCSTDDSYEKLKWHFRDNDKVKLFQNKKNLDCYFNKHQAMLNANSDWGILLDSDNVIDKSYLDAIYAIKEWDKHTFYLPDFARPHFSAKEWSGLTVIKENMAQYADTHLATNFNAMNFFIHREEYLRIWDDSVEPITSDSIYFSFCWVSAGNKILVTPNLEYDHTIHDTKEAGHYTSNQHKTVDFHKQLMNKIRALK